MLRPTTAISHTGKLSLPHAAQCHSASWEEQGFKGTSGLSCRAPHPSIRASTIVQGAGTLGPHLAVDRAFVSLCLYSPFPSPFVFQRLGVEGGVLRNSVQWPGGKGLGGSGLQGDPQITVPVLTSHMPKKSPGHMPGRARPHHPPRTPRNLAFKAFPVTSRGTQLGRPSTRHGSQEAGPHCGHHTG